MNIDSSKWLKVFLTLTAVGSVVQWYLTGENAESHWEPVEPNALSQQEIKQQKTAERKWKHIQCIEKRWDLPKWGGVTVDDFGNVYLWDYDLTLKKFSPLGQFITRFGKGRGGGPGEFLTPNDVAVDNDLSVWVCDGGTGMVTVFDSDGSLRKTIRIRSLPYRIQPLRNGFVIQKVMASQYLFEIYDLSGMVKLEFGSNLVPLQEKFPILLAGTMVTHNDDLYYTFFYYGRLMAFSLIDGKLKYAIGTMDRVSIPKVQTREAGENLAMRIDPEAAIASLDLYFESDNLIVKSGVTLREPRNGPRTVLDVYAAADGQYLYSYEVPKNGFLKNGYFYETADTLVTKWEIRID